MARTVKKTAKEESTTKNVVVKKSKSMEKTKKPSVRAKKATAYTPALIELFDKIRKRQESRKITAKFIAQKAKGLENSLNSIEDFSMLSFSDIARLAKVLGYTEIRVKL